MKIIIRNALISVFLSTLFGAVFGRLIYDIYVKDASMNLNSDILYLLEDNEYNNYDEMRANRSTNSYVYYQEEDKYKSVIGITKNKDNIIKIKNNYNNNIKVEEYYLNNNEVSKRIDYYDNLLLKEEDDKTIMSIINDMLAIYNSNNKIKLVKVS